MVAGLAAATWCRLGGVSPDGLPYVLPAAMSAWLGAVALCVRPATVTYRAAGAVYALGGAWFARTPLYAAGWPSPPVEALLLVAAPLLALLLLHLGRRGAWAPALAFGLPALVPLLVVLPGPISPSYVAASAAVSLTTLAAASAAVAYLTRRTHA